MSTLQEFFGYVSKNGLAKTNRFQVIIPLPSILNSVTNNQGQNKPTSLSGNEVVEKTSGFFGGGNSQISRGLSLMCDQTSLPGKNLAATDIKYNGDFFKLPYSSVYGVQEFVFKVSKNLYEKNIIDEWMNLIYNPITHEIEYMDNYVSDIYVNQLDDADNVVQSIMLKNAFPTLSSPITVSNEERDSLIKLMTTFAYTRWVRMGEVQQKSNDNSFGNSNIPNPIDISTNPFISQSGINNAINLLNGGTSLPLTGEAGSIFNTIQDIVSSSTPNNINKHISSLQGIKESALSNPIINTNERNEITNLIDKLSSTMRQ